MRIKTKKLQYSSQDQQFWQRFPKRAMPLKQKCKVYNGRLHNLIPIACYNRFLRRTLLYRARFKKKKTFEVHV